MMIREVEGLICPFDLQQVRGGVRDVAGLCTYKQILDTGSRDEQSWHFLARLCCIRDMYVQTSVVLIPGINQNHNSKMQ